MLLKIYTIFIVLFLCSLQSAVAFNPRMSKNGFVAAVGTAPQGMNIATGWSMGFPIGGFTTSKSGEAALISSFWSKQYFASQPPAPDIAVPKVVLGGTTGEYESIDFFLEISGKKPPYETYAHYSTVIAYTNGVRFLEITQLPDNSLWGLELELAETEKVTLTLITSNMFGKSSSPTVLKITQIPEPGFLILGLVFISCLVRFKRNYKFLICLTLLSFTFFNATEAECAKFNYQGVIELEGGAYSGDGYFKFTVGDAAQTTNFWANDGTKSGEPTATKKISVSNGFFHTELGGSGMFPLPKSLFFSTNQLFLTVWFNHLPVNDFYKLGPPQQILPVPMALNSDLLDGHDYQEILDTAYTNATDLFLLRTGDICSGQLQVSNLVTDTNVELPDDGRIYLNSSKDAYISADNSGNVTIFKNNLPVFEIE